MKAEDVKMYSSSLEIVKRDGKEECCGDFLGGRITANHTSNEKALDSIKDAVYIFFFCCIMRKDKSYKNMKFTIWASNSTIYDNNKVDEIVECVTYKDMIQLIKDGYRSPMFDKKRDKALIEIRLKELKIA